MIQLNIAELLRTPDMTYQYPVHETLPASRDLDYASPIVGYLDFHRTANMLIVRGELEAAVREQCVRCLDEVIVPIQSDVEEEFSIEAMRVVANVNEDAGIQSIQDLFKDQDLILDEFIRQHLLLAKPEYPLCANDCRGLCPQCGCDLNNGACECAAPPPDSRLARLVELYGESRN